MIELASMRLTGRLLFVVLLMALAALSMSCSREAKPESSTANDARVKELEAELARVRSQGRTPAPVESTTPTAETPPPVAEEVEAGPNPIRILSVEAASDRSGGSVAYVVKVQNTRGASVAARGTLIFLDDFGASLRTFDGNFTFQGNQVTEIRSLAALSGSPKRLRIQLATTRWGVLTGEGLVESGAANLQASAPTSPRDVVMLGAPGFVVDEDRVQAAFSLYNRGAAYRSGQATIRLLKSNQRFGSVTVNYGLAPGATQDFVEFFRNDPLNPGAFALEMEP